MTGKPIYQPKNNVGQQIAILESDQDVFDTLAVLLRLDGFDVLRAETSDDLINSIVSSRPLAVILPITLRGVSLVKTIATIKHARLGCEIIGLADKEAPELAVAAMKAGARDVVFRPYSSERIITLVRELAKKRMLYDPLGRVMYMGVGALSPREREVMDNLIDGLTNREIGDLLGISPRTVEVHRAKILRKLGARNVADLTRIVVSA